MSEDEKHWMLKAMEVYGGSFVKALGMAWCRADYVNSLKLERTFPEYVNQYLEKGRGLYFKAEEEKK